LPICRWMSYDIKGPLQVDDFLTFLRGTICGYDMGI
jgi:hypothetical protein